MADAVQLIAELIDKVSGPAKKASAGLKNMNKAAKNAGRGTGNLNRATTRFNKSGRAIDANTGRFVKMGGAARGATGIIARLGGAAGIAGGVVLGLVAAVGFLAVKAAQAFLALGKAVFKSFLFTEGLEFSLTRFLGSAKLAKNAMKDVLKISSDLGIEFKTAAEQFKAFISAGFTQEQAKNLLRFKADVEALSTGTPEAIGRITEAFKQIEKAQATGRIEADAFNSILSNLPVTKLQVLKKLAELTGKSLKELQNTDVTKLPVEELLESFRLATLEATKAAKSGDVAVQKQFKTVGGALNAISNRFSNIITQLGIELGPTIQKHLMPALKEVFDFLKSPAAKKIFTAVLNGAKTFIKFVSVGFKNLVGVVKAFFAGFQKGRGELSGVASAMSGVASPNFAESIRAFGEAVADLAGKLGELIGKLDAALEKLNQFGKIAGGPGGGGPIGAGPLGAGGLQAPQVAALQAGGQEGGAAMSAGLAAGIREGKSSVIQAASETAGAAIAAAKAKLGIASPSRVFESFGQLSAMGFAEGMSDAPQVATLNPANVQTGGGGGTVNQTNNFGGATVNEAASAAATATEIRRQQMLSMAAAFERAAAELGVRTGSR